MPINLKLLRAFPVNFFILDIDTPKFTIIDGSDKHFSELGMKREDIVGKGVFEAFPDNEANNFSSGHKLLQSFMNVMETLAEDFVFLQYDIPIPDRAGFEYRYWSVQNSPYIEDGKLKYIFNIPTNATRIFNLSEDIL